jgi:2-oxo-3-hexenedioate decarboxylase/2-keto-4-pentenoate hydratase
MERDAVGDAANALIGARISGKRIEALPAAARPDSEADAYAIQDAYIERLLSNYGGARIGYKAGCTNPAAQQQLGLSAPFRGVLLSAFARYAPTEISCKEGFMRMIEAEIGYRVAHDLPLDGAPYDAISVSGAIGETLPAIEVVDSRYLEWTGVGAPQLIADNGATGFWVYGDAVPGLGGIDPEDHAVQLYRNGEKAEAGNASNVLGSPLNALAWLANHLADYGRPLQSGDLITTGTMIPVNPAFEGDEIVADFGSLGEVSITFV